MGTSQLGAAVSQVQIQPRRDISSNLTSTNPVLAQGEIGVELDTGNIKIGDGLTAWTSLGYFTGYTTAPTFNYVPNSPIVSAAAVTIAAPTHRISTITVSATTAITMLTTGATDKMLAEVCILDGGTGETLSWVNTENSSVSAPLVSNGSTTLPLSTVWQFNGGTTKWRYAGSF